MTATEAPISTALDKLSSLAFQTDLTNQNITNQVPPSSTRSLLVGIWAHLSIRRRIQLALLLLGMLASALAELLSLGAVIPLLAVLSNTDLVWRRSIVQEFAGIVGFTEAHQLLFPAAVIFATAAVLAAFVRIRTCGE